jgi:hypothetical protein
VNCSKICLATLSLICLCLCGAQQEQGRFAIVCNVPDDQFRDLYENLTSGAKKIGSFFDPRYACITRTDGCLKDFHGNLHITLVSCDAVKSNEEKCRIAIKDALCEYRDQQKKALLINFLPRSLRYSDYQKYLILPLEKDGGYGQLHKLSQLIGDHLRRQGATGIKVKNPDHVTIGFLGKKAAHKLLPVNEQVHGCLIKSIVLYHWRPAKDPAINSREEFYPKGQYQI